jgi:hypothetical protein
MPAHYARLARGARGARTYGPPRYIGLELPRPSSTESAGPIRHGSRDATCSPPRLLSAYYRCAGARLARARAARLPHTWKQLKWKRRDRPARGALRGRRASVVMARPAVLGFLFFIFMAMGARFERSHRVIWRCTHKQSTRSDGPLIDSRLVSAKHPRLTPTNL